MKSAIHLRLGEAASKVRSSTSGATAGSCRSPRSGGRRRRRGRARRCPRLMDHAKCAWPHRCGRFITFATLSPAHLRPELTATEPALVVAFERGGAFAVLGLLFSSGYPRRYGLVSVIVVGSAILFEFLQILVPDRDARMVDAIEKILRRNRNLCCSMAPFVPASA